MGGSEYNTQVAEFHQATNVIGGDCLAHVTVLCTRPFFEPPSPLPSTHFSILNVATPLPQCDELGQRGHTVNPESEQDGQRSLYASYSRPPIGPGHFSLLRRPTLLSQNVSR